MESSCECGIEPPGSISHGVSYTYKKETFRKTLADNIRMNLEEIVIHTKNWVDSAQDRDYWKALVNAAINMGVP